MTFRQPDLRTLIILGFATTLLALGVAFVARPAVGATIFGLPADDPTALRYVAALGFRDLGLGAAMVLVALCSPRRAIGALMAAIALIPFCDLLLVAVEGGRSSAAALALHGASAVILIGLSAWSLRRAR